ncbi:MAG TPA: PRC-barrel domain-containing protein [Chroococcidiopsis sp.]
MTSEQYRQRSDFLGTQVITRDTGRRLGVVSQLWVDVDRREVVALGIRENILSGVISNTQQTMYLEDIRQVGDVVLVDDDQVLEDDINTEAFSVVVNSEVITETGELLGKVRGFRFNVGTGKVDSLIVASIGLPQIPDQIISTYELSMDEVVSSGPDRLIVFEGAEEKMSQLTVGVLERLGIGKPPWQRDEEEDYIMPTSVANQLGTGLKTTATQPARMPAPATREWDDDNWNESRREVREPLRQRQPEPVYDEQDNWNDEEEEMVYVDRQPREEPRQREMAVPYEEVLDDAWADDDNPQPYRAPELNIPERKKVVEYEEETDY